MNKHLIATLTIALCACGGSQQGDSNPATGSSTGASTSTAVSGDGDKATGKKGRKVSDAGEFQINTGDKSSRPKQGKLKATDTEAAVRFFVIDKDKGPIEGIVISLTSPTGEKYYTAETDAEGFTEVLVPIGQTYELVYLSLGRRDTAARVKVKNEPRLNLKLTMRYKRERYATGVVPETETESEPAPAPASAPAPAPAPRFVLDNVHFPTGKATIKSESYARLDKVVEYMTYKKSARIEISGHTDNVGKKRANKRLSQKRAEAVRDYLVSKGIDASRIKAVGHGSDLPIASNDTPEGRRKNRRIEATEL